MKRALIGYTGFVGGNLARQTDFEDLYNSRNIEQIAGRHYDLIVCAGAPAAKWLANKEPETDRRAIDRLITPLQTVTADAFVLISTVDVYPSPVIGVDEDTPIDPNQPWAYGFNRRRLEVFVAERFVNHFIIRLPGLYGDGLKKNAIYDLLHDNQVEKIHCESVFQFYCLDNLWADVQRVMAADLRLVNWATEPTRLQELIADAFGMLFDNRPGAKPVVYDMRTRHADRFGGQGSYIYSRARITEELRAYVARERSRLQ